MNTYGYIKTACATPELVIGDVKANAEELLQICKQIDPEVRILVFPELCLCGYTCQDLFYQSPLLEQIIQGLFQLTAKNENEAILVVGCSLRQGNHLFNCAVFIHQHKILGIVHQNLSSQL